MCEAVCVHAVTLVLCKVCAYLWWWMRWWECELMCVLLPVFQCWLQRQLPWLSPACAESSPTPSEFSFSGFHYVVSLTASFICSPFSSFFSPFIPLTDCLYPILMSSSSWTSCGASHNLILYTDKQFFHIIVMRWEKGVVCLNKFELPFTLCPIFTLGDLGMCVCERDRERKRQRQRNVLYFTQVNIPLTVDHSGWWVQTMVKVKSSHVFCGLIWIQIWGQSYQADLQISYFICLIVENQCCILRILYLH